MGNRHRTKRNEAGELVCIVDGCGAVLEWIGKGRMPVFCTLHKNPSNRPSA